MKRTIWILSLVVAFGLTSLSQATESFTHLAYQAIDQTWRELKYFGLWEMDPWAPGLPRPQIPALRAVVSRRNGLLAYFDEENGLGETTLVFKNPNGGYRHSVTFARDGISFLTPYQGTVAHANGLMTVNGPAYQFYCQSRLVTEQGFYSCVDRLFIKVIVNQLRRYAR